MLSSQQRERERTIWKDTHLNDPRVFAANKNGAMFQSETYEDRIEETLDTRPKTHDPPGSLNNNLKSTKIAE